MNEPATQPDKSAPHSARKGLHKKYLYGVVALLIVVGLFLGGYLLGKSQTATQPKRTQTQASSQVFSGRTKNGEITAVSKDSIDIRNADRTETVTVTSKTKVSKQNETLEVGSLKKGDRVIIFTGSDNVATRIVVRP